MALDLPDAAAGDNQLTALNTRVAAIEAAINDFDGSAIDAATVANSALAKPKHVHSVVVQFESLSGLSNGDKIAEFELPEIDGASNSTWKYLGYSVWLRAATAVAGCSLSIRANGVQQDSVDLNPSSTSLTDAEYFMLATAVSTATDVRWSVVYVESGAPTYTGLYLVLYFSLENVGT